MRRAHIAAIVALLGAAARCPAAEPDGTVTLSEIWSIHGQTTFTWQGYPSFHADFSGANSFEPRQQIRKTADATLFLGARLADGLAFYVNPEIDQGYGLSDTLGAAGFPSGEAYKIGHDAAYSRLPRAFLRYRLDLGGAAVNESAGANSLAATHTEDNLTITAGKFSVPDLFDGNKYAHDPKADFLNWSLIESGAFDYAADSWGYTFGAAAEWTQSWWTLRAGIFDLSVAPNSPQLEVGLHQYSAVAEAEERHEWWAQPGALKLLVFANRGRMGGYDDAVAQGAALGLPAADTSRVRRYATRPGAALDLQQQLLGDLGVFARASINDGSKETFDFTDINRSYAGGLSLQGTRWGRPDDVVGFAGVVNGLSAAARRYFSAGGLGLLIGDGALPRYRPEKIVETYYSLRPAEWAAVSLDVQFIDNPAYNAQRGPVTVFALRLHAEF